jgi:hypothetical protein
MRTGLLLIFDEIVEKLLDLGCFIHLVFSLLAGGVGKGRLLVSRSSGND